LMSHTVTTRHDTKLTAELALELITLSLHDALPILIGGGAQPMLVVGAVGTDVKAVGAGAAFAQAVDVAQRPAGVPVAEVPVGGQDRKSTRLNSSHVKISYAVFCLTKKKKPH